jgi:hypothetical protein
MHYCEIHIVHKHVEPLFKFRLFPRGIIFDYQFHKDTACTPYIMVVSLKRAMLESKIKLLYYVRRNEALTSSIAPYMYMNTHMYIYLCMFAN